MVKFSFIWAAFFCLMPVVAQAQSHSVWIEDLTWTEIRTQLDNGSVAALIPTGGTEQNGPQLATGKHNWIVRHTAEAIAKQLGHTLVAPVIAYVPEGTISPPQDHMRFAGTLSVREQTFAALLEDTARSLKQHGFTRIYFIGDHGGSQATQKAVAEKLSLEWQPDGILVLNVDRYYTNPDAKAWASSSAIGAKSPDAHAGFMDTSELWAAHAAGVRPSLIGHQPPDFAVNGLKGDPSLASESHGKKLLEFKVRAAVEQIKRAAAINAGK